MTRKALELMTMNDVEFKDLHDGTPDFEYINCTL